MLNDEQLRKLRAGTVPWQRRTRTASEAQQKFIADLIESRQVPESWLLSIKNYADTGTLTTAKASQIITALKDRPYKQRPGGDGGPDRRIDLGGVPSGYYAYYIENAKNNDIVFYRVKTSKKDPTKGWVHIVLGPDEGELRQSHALAAINRIKKFGVGKAAELYGEKLGRCSQCNRRLTNRLSRELKIGPVCGERVSGEDWRDRVNIARQAIIERGEDPNESIPEEA